MENDSGFPGTHLPWQPSAADFAGTAPLGFELQQCLLQQFDSGLGPIARLDGFGSLPLLPHQWSSSCLPTQGVNSTPKLNLSMAAAPSFGAGEPAFAEIAARIHGFAPNYAVKFPLSETGRLHGGVDCRNDGSRTSRSSGAGEGELRGLPAESSASDHTSNDGNGRKRKSAKAGEESGEGSRKRSRVAETGCGGGKDAVKPKLEVTGTGEEQKPDVGTGKASEAPKQDYIHVRARRGQATDAHSLAERVRREKISERMKFLQNLVPGCNKVTGKAVMLDEIINYVQSLQRQVEFLSMKLATVNPRLEIDVENILQKDMMHPPVYPMEAPPSFPFANPSPQAAPLQNIASSGMESHCSSNPLNLMLPRRPLAVQPPSIHGLSADTGSQVAAGFWGDDLHRVVQMGSGQSQEDIKIKL